MTVALKTAALAAIDARIAALPVYSAQAVALVQTITPTERADEDSAPWAGLAADIRRLP